MKSVPQRGSVWLLNLDNRYAQSRATRYRVVVLTSSPMKFARTSALAGALLWGVTLLIRTGDSRETELIQKIFLLAVFVIVPLCLSLITADEDSLALRIAVWLQPFAAVVCFVSFLIPQGMLAGVLSSVWLATISFVALAGLLRIFFAESFVSYELSVSAGMLYLPIGGAWLVASRLGIQPLGFGDTIVLLTAIHFHFAGFAAPLLAGLAGRAVRDKQTASRVVGLAATGIILGTPLVAAGITFSPAVALVGTAIVSLGLSLLAVIVLFYVVPATSSIVAKALFFIASLSSIAAMVLACLYAYSIVTHTLVIDIPHMAMTHGLLNSFGFALSSLIAWTLSPPPKH